MMVGTSKKYHIRKVQKADLVQLQEILKNWIRWKLKIVKNQAKGVIINYEVNDILADISDSIIHKNAYSYFVMLADKKIIGMVGMRPPAMNLSNYLTDKDKTIEMQQLFFRLEFREKGLELELVKNLFQKAKKLGYKRVCWDSGSRYKETLWPLYTKNFGKPTVVGKSFYDNLDSMIWEVKL
jgi:hypothetical protein